MLLLPLMNFPEKNDQVSHMTKLCVAGLSQCLKHASLKVKFLADDYEFIYVERDYLYCVTSHASILSIWHLIAPGWYHLFADVAQYEIYFLLHYLFSRKQ